MNHATRADDREAAAELPIVALTLGDVAGVGPEVVARAAVDARVTHVSRPLVVGHPEILRRSLRLIDCDVPVEPVDSPSDMATGRSVLRCWNPGIDDRIVDVAAGEIDARAGGAAFECLAAATHAALEGEIDAIVTAPLNKAALQAAGHRYPGHTEILAERCGVERFAMMLYLPPGPSFLGSHGLGVAHVTLHTSIRSVPDLLSPGKVREKIDLVDGFLRRLDCAAPRIGVCALNPHAGEEGLFGDEEARSIAPAVREAIAGGLDAAGPLPADTLLQRAVAGEFDGVVAMYHDQGHIALKLIGFDRAVNVTLGLPIVRTSPSHGTAFDIAWKGRANASGMVEAIGIAVRLARRR